MQYLRAEAQTALVPKKSTRAAAARQPAFLTTLDKKHISLALRAALGL